MKYAIYSVGKWAAKSPDQVVFRNGIESVKQSVVAFEGPVIVEAPADDFFGGEESKPYRSRVMRNPTWGSLLRVLDQQIAKTKDRHHCFLEDARVVGVRQINGEQVKVVQLSLGS